jgi:SET domain-containing protein
VPTAASRSRARPDLAFEIRRSSIQGRGAFATRRIRAGQRLIEYTGDRISPDEGDRRYEEDGMQRHHTFLFTLDDDTVIDGGRGGNESRYINHSCDPNCEAVIEDGRIFIYAKRNIQPGSELTYDYQYERFDWHTPEDEAFYACLCGSPKCRGSILKGKRKRAAGADKAAGKAPGAKKGATKAAKDPATRAPTRGRGAGKTTRAAKRLAGAR